MTITRSVPEGTPDEQRWFYHPENRIAQAEADIAAGRVTYCETEEEVIAFFDSLKDITN